MRRLWPAVVLAASVRADFTRYYFSANSTCPDVPYKCGGPLGLCGFEAVTSKYYCCSSGESYPLCWGGSTPCSSSSETLSCQTGKNQWCCLNGAETCTQVKDQFNVCHATAENLLSNITIAALNASFSSLSSANPSATAWSIDASEMDVEATASSTTTATSPSSSSSSSYSLSFTSSASSTTSSPSSLSPSSLAPTAAALTSSPASTSPTPSPSQGLSGGAIAGIVIGAVVGGLLLAAAAYLLGRYQKRASTASWSSNPHDAQWVEKDIAHPADTPIYQNSTSPQRLLPQPVSEMNATGEIQELGHIPETRELYTEPAELHGSETIYNPAGI